MSYLRQKEIGQWRMKERSNVVSRLMATVAK
jgi:hypothetical protein